MVVENGYETLPLHFPRKEAFNEWRVSLKIYENLNPWIVMFCGNKANSTLWVLLGVIRNICKHCYVIFWSVLSLGVSYWWRQYDSPKCCYAPTRILERRYKFPWIFCYYFYVQFPWTDIHGRPTLGPVMSQFNPVYSFIEYFSKSTLSRATNVD